MIVGVPKESYPGERRVALIPVVVPILKKAGLDVVVEAGAGLQAGYPDAGYSEKGAKILPTRAEVFSTADIIVQVLCYGSNDITGKADLPLLKRGQSLIGFLRPFGDAEVVQQIAKAGVNAYAVELMPRTTRAQSMDALSSMGTICGVDHRSADGSTPNHRYLIEKRRGWSLLNRDWGSWTGPLRRGR